MDFRSAILLVLSVGLAFLSGCAANNAQSAQNQTNQSWVINMANDSKEIAVLETSMGAIEIELDRADAPKTVENFVSYVNSGFYDGTVFHRVIPGFMVQGGGFTPDGTQKNANAPVPLESANGLKNNAGAVAMARTNDPNSATSQFFINVADNGFLDYAPGNPGYAVFGKVVSGMDVVEKIEKVQTSSRSSYDDWPVQDIVIERAYMK